MSTHPSKARPDRRRWWRARRRGTLPLAVLTVITALVGWSSPGQVEWPWLVSGLGIYLLLLVAQVLRSPTTAPVWSRGVLMLVCYLAFATTRHGAGAAASGFTPLSVLPVLGAGLYGRRRDVALALAGGVVALALPIALDPAAYPAATEERRTLLWLIANTLVVITMHRLVSSHRRTIEHLDLLATTSRDLSTAPMPARPSAGSPPRSPTPTSSTSSSASPPPSTTHPRSADAPDPLVARLRPRSLHAGTARYSCSCPRRTPTDQRVRTTPGCLLKRAAGWSRPPSSARSMVTQPRRAAST